MRLITEGNKGDFLTELFTQLNYQKKEIIFFPLNNNENSRGGTHW